MVSTTDPDAAIVRKGSLGPRARYKHHRVVDDRFGVVTAVETTAGDGEENARLMDLVDQHQRNTLCPVETVVADTQYGTVENFRALIRHARAPRTEACSESLNKTILAGQTLTAAVVTVAGLLLAREHSTAPNSP